MGQMVWESNFGRGKRFFRLWNVQTNSVALPGSLPRVEQLGHEVNHSPQSGVSIKSEWGCTPTYAFVVWTGKSSPSYLFMSSVDFVPLPSLAEVRKVNRSYICSHYVNSSNRSDDESIII
jgi:hypothetical protein